MKASIHISSGKDKHGLFIESASSVFWIYLSSGGAVTREVNCKKVDSFPPKSRNAKALESAFNKLKTDLNLLNDYAKGDNEEQYREVFWLIKNKLKEI